MNPSEFIDTLLFNQNVNLSMSTLITSLIVATFLSLVPVKIYQSQRPGGQYTDSFLVSLLIFSLLSTVITLVIGSNFARAFGLVGVLSIIRFRTALKSPIDAVFTFWSLTIGVACGTSNYLAAFVLCLFVGGLIFLSPFILKFGAKKREVYLRVEIPLEKEKTLRDYMTNMSFYSLNEYRDESSNLSTILFYQLAGSALDIEKIKSDIQQIEEKAMVVVEEGIRKEFYAY